MVRFGSVSLIISCFQKRATLTHSRSLLLLSIRCGYTPQFEGLEELNKKYKDQGLVILGFPCNQFAGQDPENDEGIGAFCQKVSS